MMGKIQAMFQTTNQIRIISQGDPYNTRILNVDYGDHENIYPCFFLSGNSCSKPYLPGSILISGRVGLTMEILNNDECI